MDSSRVTRRQWLAGMTTTAALSTAPGRFAVGASGPADVIILGAGLAGLNAALNIEDAGLRATVLEGTGRIGGRLFTADESIVPGHPEMGGSGIGSSYARILYAAKRFKVVLGPSRPRTESRDGELMYHLRGQGIKVEDWPEHPFNPFADVKRRSTQLNYFQFTAYSDEANPLPSGDLAAWQDGSYANHDISVHEFLSRQGMSSTAIKLGAGTNMSYGSNAHDLSVLMGFQSANMVRSLYRGENAFSAGSFAAVGGNQKIPQAMARELQSEIVLNQHVRAIENTADGVTVHCNNGATFSAKYCICTLPFSALRHVRVEPGLSGTQAEAVASLPYTPVFQVHSVPKEAYWEEDGLPPSMWTDSTPGRFMALKNDPDEPDRVTSCLSFVNGDMAKFLDKLDPREATALVLADLARMRPSTKGVLDVKLSYSWNRTPFAGGAYAYWKPGQITRFARSMRAPAANVHFAGEHTAVANRGMEGAMESGERAAIEVMQRLG